MKMQKAISAGVMSLGLVVGLSSFAGAEAGNGSISTTGYKSYNVISHRTSHNVRVSNDNDLRVDNSNHQSAWTGDAGVYHNTTVGDVSTGSASNDNTTHLSATIDNSASTAAAMPATSSSSSVGGGGSIDTTGAYSNNQITSTDTTHVSISNDNDLSVRNSSDQHASSGDARVSGNTTVGDVTTGDATNTNSTTISLNVTN